MGEKSLMAKQLGTLRLSPVFLLSEEMRDLVPGRHVEKDQEDDCAGDLGSNDSRLRTELKEAFHRECLPRPEVPAPTAFSAFIESAEFTLGVKKVAVNSVFLVQLGKMLVADFVYPQGLRTCRRTR
jgi:hypothetical protein